MTPETVESILKSINQDNNGGIFLPYVQRDFVWEKEKIYSLLDSLMRGYPIGTILTWETDEAIDYRPFAQDYSQTYDFDETMVEGKDGSSRRYVLDGQQRLQSLFLVRNGTYDGGVLFFDLASNPDDAAYSFQFQSKGYKSPGWLNVPKFLAMNFKGLTSLDLEEAGLIPDCGADKSKQSRMAKNAIRLYEALKTKKNIPIQNLAMTDDIGMDDLAEIFVRINSEGVVLEKADLIMALLRGKWRGADKNIGQLVNTIRSRGFNSPKDFILQCCVAMLSGKVPGKGKKNGLAQLFAASEVQDNLVRNITKISEAIMDVVSFIAEFSFLPPSKIPTYNPILILACYRYTHGKNAWDGVKNKAKAFLFAAFLSKALSGQSQKLVESLLAQVMKNSAFDLSAIEKICKANKRDIGVDVDELLDILMDDPLALLVMHLAYQGMPGYDPKMMTQRDHIFPKSEVSEYRVNNRGRRVYVKRQYDSIVNCEMLTEEENREKANFLPQDYFAALRKKGRLRAFLDLHRIPEPQDGAVNIWDMHFFREFLDQRRGWLHVVIEQNLQGLVSATISKKRTAKRETKAKN